MKHKNKQWPIGTGCAVAAGSVDALISSLSRSNLVSRLPAGCIHIALLHKCLTIHLSFTRTQTHTHTQTINNVERKRLVQPFIYPFSEKYE